MRLGKTECTDGRQCNANREDQMYIWQARQCEWERVNAKMAGNAMRMGKTTCSRGKEEVGVH